jgi:amino acid transporter
MAESKEFKGTMPDLENTTSHNDVGRVEQVDQLHRSLSNRQIQWLALGGSIGTALFVSIGWGLLEGGPGSLFIAFVFYSAVIGSINSGLAEMTVYMPVAGGFLRFASKWVDDAFGFMAGWNFFLYEAILIPFEISALSLVLTFWRDDIPVWAICLGCIVLYAIINVFAVRWYGEAEFWLSSGKLLLILILYSFTFITMVGGNPKHDPYGFRYWSNPGSFAEYITTGSLGKFEGFLGSLFTAAFTVCGPEYISMVAAEAVYPRITIKMAFKTVYWRFGAFFILGALCVGIVLPYNDNTLVTNLSTKGGSTGASSAYIIAMQNMGVHGLPHLVNALLVTSIFSAGNTYVFMATRSLYSLSLQGQAPRFLRATSKNGIPYYCFLVTMIFPFLSFLQVSSGSAQALKWLVNIITASQEINYIVMGTTYLFFYRALKAQGVDRRTLPYRGWCQPYVNIFGLTIVSIVVCIQGYYVFMPGSWDIGNFFTYYTMIFACLVFFLGWKLIKRTKFVPAATADLAWEKPLIDAYEEATDPPLGLWEDIWVSFLATIRVRKWEDRRRMSVARRRSSVASLSGEMQTANSEK